MVVIPIIIRVLGIIQIPVEKKMWNTKSVEKLILYRPVT